MLATLAAYGSATSTTLIRRLRAKLRGNGLWGDRWSFGAARVRHCVAQPCTLHPPPVVVLHGLVWFFARITSAPAPVPSKMPPTNASPCD
eukprot:gene12936-biopygen6692